MTDISPEIPPVYLDQREASEAQVTLAIVGLVVTFFLIVLSFWYLYWYRPRHTEQAITEEALIAIFQKRVPISIARLVLASAPQEAAWLRRFYCNIKLNL